MASLSWHARHYSLGFFQWREASGLQDSKDPGDPLSVVTHFAGLIGSKTRRAVSGLNEDDGNRDYPPDFEGSAKVAIDDIERSISAWTDLASTGRVSSATARGFILQLQWVLGEIDDLIPNARAFVRAGFDEPDEVAKLEASDWS